MPSKTPAPRLSKAEQRARTIQQILDVAEHLFSLYGLYGVTLMQVAKEVGVHKTLMNYYFVDKQALYDAVVQRRAPVTRDRRIAAMDEYEQSCGGAPTLEGALHAFLDTDLDLLLNGDDGWRNWGRFGGQISNTADGAEAMNEWFDPVVMKLIDLIKKAMPQMSEADVFWGYHFVTGSLLNTLSQTGRIDRLSQGLCKSGDFEAIRHRMATFMAAGFRALDEQERLTV